MVGEKWNHRRCRRQYVALEHGTCLHSCRVGDISSRCFTFASMGLGNLFWPLICSLPRHHDLWSVDVKYCQVHCRAVHVFKRSWPLQISTFLCFSYGPNSQQNVMFLCLVSMMWESLWPTFDQGHFLSTSTHYPGSWSRDSLWYLGACMPQWQVRRIRREVYIIGLRSNDSAGVRRQLIYSHAVDCTCSTLKTIFIIGGFSRFC